MKKIIDCLNKYLTNVHTIIIGCSGGPDSMFLLHELITYQNNKNLKIIVAHVNHNIRPTSHKDLKFVSQFCQQHNLIFESTTLNETNHTEAHLRTKRYAFFHELIIKYQADMLLTAHHADDLMETILMRLTRGSNLKGYSGFPILSTSGKYPIFRPLISLTKEEIIKYNNIHNINYVIDETNTSDNYTRNRYRNHILPFLKQENKKVHEKFLEYSIELIKAQNLIDNLVNKYFTQYYHEGLLDLTHINEQDPLIKQKIIEHYLSLLYPDNLDLLSKKHLNLVLNLLDNPQNSRLDLPNNITLLKEYNLLKTHNLSTDNSEYQIILTSKQSLPNDYTIAIIPNSSDTSNYTIRLNSSEIKLPLIVRNKKSGDKMSIKNLNGTKKVQDILINSKIPKSLRNNYPILTDSNNELLWLPGLKKSKFDKSKQEKYDIIVKYYSNSAQKEKNYEEK